METLPLLVLETICEYLVCADAKPRDLQAFALTSRACCAAAERERFCRVFLDVRGADHLRHELQRLQSVLAVGDRRRFVRMIKVRGIIRKNNPVEGDETYGDEYGDEAGVENDDDDDSNEAGKDPFAFEPDYGISYYDKFGDFTPENRAWLNEAWMPFPLFTQGLHLKDLIWASPSQVPLCVLSMLHVNMPFCRLHVHMFDLRSMHCESGSTPVIEESERILATSPSLHSIAVSCSGYDMTGDADYNEEALHQMVAGSAPNLKHVHTWCGSRASGELRAVRPPRVPWRGFDEEAYKSAGVYAHRGQLLSLTIQPGGSELSDQEIWSWESSTDFHYLHALRFKSSVGLGALHRLGELAEAGQFAHLKELEISATASDYAVPSDVDQAVARVLTSLPPLEVLVSESIGNSTINEISESHGIALRRLEIGNYILSKNDVQKLQTNCLSLTELSIEILRTGGDKKETELYRTLGKMPKLKKLTLHLRCTALRERGPNTSATEMGDPSSPYPISALVAEMRKILINSALDDKLARSIFDTICAASTTAFPSLSYLALRPAGAHIVHNCHMYEDFNNVVGWIGHEWLVRRDPRDTHRDEVEAKEIEGVHISEKRSFQVNQLDFELDDLRGSAKWPDLWKELWPETGRGWKNDWHSFPLALEHAEK
jgi:hypothetical protein